MDQSPPDSTAMRYVKVSEGEGNSINVSWTKMWDYYLLVFLVTSPLWIVMFAFLFVLLGGFVGGILHYIPMSIDMKITIATSIPKVLSIVMLLGSILAGVVYVVLRRPLTTLKIEEGMLRFMKIQFPTNDINRITYYVQDEPEPDTDDEDLPEWMTKFFRILDEMHLFVIQIFTSGDRIPFTVSVPRFDGPTLVQYLSEYIGVPYELDFSEGTKHLSDEERILLETEQMKKEASETYHDWDNKTAGRWILDYFTKFLPRLFIGLAILGIIGVFLGPGMDYVQF